MPLVALVALAVNGQYWSFHAFSQAVPTLRVESFGNGLRVSRPSRDRASPVVLAVPEGRRVPQGTPAPWHRLALRAWRPLATTIGGRAGTAEQLPLMPRDRSPMTRVRPPLPPQGARPQADARAEADSGRPTGAENPRLVTELGRGHDLRGLRAARGRGHQSRGKAVPGLDVAGGRGVVEVDVEHVVVSGGAARVERRSRATRPAARC